MNTTLKIITSENPANSLSSNEDAIACLNIIKSNFSQTKNELFQFGLLGERPTCERIENNLCLQA